MFSVQPIVFYYDRLLLMNDFTSYNPSMTLKVSCETKKSGVRLMARPRLCSNMQLTRKIQ